MVVGADKCAETVASGQPFRIRNLVLSFHPSDVGRIKEPVRQPQIAVSELHPLEAQGVVTEIEVRRLVLAGIKDLDTVVIQMVVAENREEQIIRFVAQHHLSKPGQDAGEEIIRRVKPVPEICECDLDLAGLHLKLS